MALLNSLFEKLLKKDGPDPESASFLASKDSSDNEQEEEVPGSCVTPAAEMERDPLGHVVSAHTIADIILDKNTEMPLTAGVFGGFGSGKSSFHAAIKSPGSMLDKTEMAAGLENDLRSVVEWGDNWLVTFNAKKTKLLSINRYREPFLPPISMNGNELLENESLRLLGLILSRDLSWRSPRRYYIESIAKSAAMKNLSTCH
ncbi:KAP P-loop domain [Branchiostoma belcheri]|nr:KAP P-loop domain [Branchiostoma belcheri]